jgi:hypothetical protein
MVRRVEFVLGGPVSAAVVRSGKALAMKMLGSVIVAISAIIAGPAVGGTLTAGAATATAGLGKAVRVPGPALSAPLSRVGRVSGISCASAGNCTAGGDYTDSHHNNLGFVVAERNGRWGKAIEMPGMSALKIGGEVFVGPVSCGSAGNCVAGGAYAYDETGFRFSSFLATERAGRWAKAVSLDRDGDIYSISCPSGGNCVAAGVATAETGEYYLIGDAFVLQQQAGRWGRVKFLPGLRKLEGFGDPEIAGSWTTSVNCSSAGNCVAGGSYTDRSHHVQGFVVLEQNGTWGKATPLAGLTALNKGGHAAVLSVSCPPRGGCGAGGSYTGQLHHQNGFITQNG